MREGGLQSGERVVAALTLMQLRMGMVLIVVGLLGLVVRSPFSGKVYWIGVWECLFPREILFLWITLLYRASLRCHAVFYRHFCV